MEDHTMLKKLLDDMPVPPPDEARFSVAQKTQLQRMKTAYANAVNQGLQNTSMVKFTLLLCILIDRSGLSVDQLRHPDAQAIIVKKAFVSDFSTADEHIGETISALRAYFNLPVLQ